MYSSIKRCSELTSGQPLYDLIGVLRKHIRNYTTTLSSKIPSFTNFKLFFNLLPRDNTKLGEREIELLCLIVNTAEYCKSRVDQFGRLFRKSVAQKFKDKVDISGEIADLKG